MFSCIAHTRLSSFRAEITVFVLIDTAQSYRNERESRGRERKSGRPFHSRWNHEETTEEIKDQSSFCNHDYHREPAHLKETEETVKREEDNGEIEGMDRICKRKRQSLTDWLPYSHETCLIRPKSVVRSGISTGLHTFPLFAITFSEWERLLNEIINSEMGFAPHFLSTLRWMSDSAFSWNNSTLEANFFYSRLLNPSLSVRIHETILYSTSHIANWSVRLFKSQNGGTQYDKGGQKTTCNNCPQKWKSWGEWSTWTHRWTDERVRWRIVRQRMKAEWDISDIGVL